MSNSNEPEPKPGLPAAGVSLGKLGDGEFDRTLKGGEAPDATGENLATDETPADEDLATDAIPTTAAPAESVPADEEHLRLPWGGLVAFRKSGGLRFTSRGIVVTRTGWIIPLEGTEGRPRHMTPEALAILERLLLQSGLTRTRHRKARATPDGYAYEITARIGRRTHAVEVTDGAIPEAMERLIRVLQRLLPG